MSTASSAPIHNYCDRWCERCFLTSKCGIYEKASATLDQDNEAFWKSIGDQLEQSLQLLVEEARKLGVDLNAVPEVDDQEREKLRENNRQHPAARLSLRYSKSVCNWNQTIPDNDHSAQVPPSSSIVNNARDVVNWYEIFIHAKVMRALSEKHSNDQWEEDGFQKDYDGSAEIALIAIERSSKASSTLLQVMSDQTSEIIGFILTLEQLKGIVETEFPAAWSFLRPGFDEG